MKKLLISLLALFLGNNSTFAQSLAPTVISSGGGYTSAGGYSLSFNIGEPVVTTTSAGSSILTQGFEQPTINAIVKFLARVFLQGAYAGSNTLNTNLPTLATFPTAQPFTGAPWNYAGTENSASIPANVTDWMLIELRDASFLPIAGGKRAVFLMSDGSLRDVDGTAGASFTGITPSNYYVIVRHRNHLAVMTSAQVALPNATTYDFTSAASAAYGTNQLKQLTDGKYALFAGDMNADGLVTVADYNLYGSNPSGINVYMPQDLNMDKLITVSDYNLYQPNASLIGVPPVRY